ncbi:hypothetical protein [Arthrobacter sp. GMC3]|uniref:hypothetical protein n=1 Tax=Arthrobacter sp. GMC3 TaxID=2058894 RepID=UPI002157C8D0|nr:hypothetical protein [Arthrobacter sp. GMC3]
MTNGAKLIKIAAAWLLVLMLAIAAAIVTIVVVNANSFGAQKPVHDYLAALRAGDGPKALGLLNARVPDANAAVLDGPGLAKSQAALKDVTVGDPVDTPDNRKSVTVGYTVNGTALTTKFVLIPGPKHWLFFDSWDIVPTTLPTLSVSVVNANQATINGIAVNMPDGKNSFGLFYPGNYEAEYRSALFAAPAVQRTVSGPQETVPAVALSTGPTSELLAQVDATIHKYLDACAAQAVLMPTNCPLSAGTNNRVASAVKWSIVEYPNVTISPYGGTWVLAPLTVKAQVEYDEQNLFTGVTAPVKDVEDFGFTAKLSINGTTVGVTPVVSY